MKSVNSITIGENTASVIPYYSNNHFQAVFWICTEKTSLKKTALFDFEICLYLALKSLQKVGLKFIVCTFYLLFVRFWVRNRYAVFVTLKNAPVVNSTWFYFVKCVTNYGLFWLYSQKTSRKPKDDLYNEWYENAEFLEFSFDLSIRAA